MTIREIGNELEKIYREMASWPDINAKLNYVITDDEIRRRELFLIGREELYKLKNATKSKNKLDKELHESTYNLIKDTLELY